MTSISASLPLGIRLKSHRPWKLLVIPECRPSGRNQKMRHLLGVDILDDRHIGRRAEEAIEQQHLVAFDQFADLLHSLGRAIAVVVGDVLDLASVYSALIVDHLEIGRLRSAYDGEGRVRTAVRHRIADFDQSIAGTWIVPLLCVTRAD